MVRHAVVLGLACVLIVFGSSPSGPTAEEFTRTLLKSTEPAEICLRPGTRYAETQGSGAPQYGTLPYPGDWPGRDVLGGDVPAVRVVTDPYPTYDGIAIDTENGLVAMSDENRGSLLVYDRTSGGQTPGVTEPKRHIIGPSAGLGFLAGVALDPKHREIITVSNDGGGYSVFSYDDHGDAKPLRKLEVPHQSWGLSLDLVNDEVAITSQQYQGISFFAPRRRRHAAAEADDSRAEDACWPIRTASWSIRPPTRSSPPTTATGPRCARTPTTSTMLPGEYVPGRFEKPSIRVHKASLDGNVPPGRTIQGPQTQLAWPMGIALDSKQNELAVANYGSNGILFFPKGANGDVAPSRVIGGRKPGSSGRSASSSTRRTTRSGWRTTATTRRSSSTARRRGTWRRSGSSGTRRQARRRPASPTPRPPPTTASATSCSCRIE